jgi:spore germination protein GerM
MGRYTASIGCLFRTLLVLLVLVVFLFNRSTIESVIEKTGLLTYLQRDRKPVTEIVVERREEPSENPGANPEKTPAPQPDSPVAKPQDDQNDTQTTQDEIAVTDSESENNTAEPLPEPSRKLRRSRVFFVEVDESGKAQLKSVVRPVYYVDSPLTDTLQSLLQGLSTDDARGGLLSLVPEGTELRGITIRGETAYIDFNESFRFNAFGSEGYKSQLQQIVFTATEFQNVKSVQFLVNGERISYLGPESPYIGEPLSRESL